MLDKVDTPTELFTHKLGAALTMEDKVLDMLGDNEAHAQSDELKALFRHHAEETRGQIRNIEGAFASLGQEPDKKMCPAIDGLKLEAKANMKLTDDRLMDDVILGAAAETEHHEIAVYEELITYAHAMGRQEVAGLMRQNLEQEQHTLEEVQRMAESVARQTLQTA
jgi:ferritin-like metal-binding protein YciE